MLMIVFGTRPKEVLKNFSEWIWLLHQWKLLTVVETSDKQIR